MKRMIAAATVALAALSAPAFAQALQISDDIEASASQGVARAASGFLLGNGTQNIHSARAQQIFHDIRAEDDDRVRTPIVQQVTREANPFSSASASKPAHGAQVQEIFDDIRAED